MINFSIVIPAYNEAENLEILIPEIYDVLKKHQFLFDIIVVNDGSTDHTRLHVEEINKNFPVKLINNKHKIGQSLSIKIGIETSLAKTIVTMDGDCQNDPSDIPNLLTIFFDNPNLKLVGGIRLNRKDTLSKKLASRIANFIRSTILQDKCKDTGCSLKVFDKKAFMKFPYFDGMHRFLPALFRGFKYETKFIEVKHRYRKKGNSNYNNFSRFLLGIRDIIKVYKIIQNFKND
jgi:dolichol-phosphate mannosyltransferase